MTIDFGPLRPASPTSAYPSPSLAPVVRPAAVEATSAGPRSDVDRAGVGVPASPPVDMLDAIAAAAARARELAADNRELHFRADELSGRIIVEVRDLVGNVIRTIPPSKALDVMTGLYGLEQT